MNNKPLFSVLIANFNNGQYIDTCIKSIVSQDYENIEIIIVDDASTDTSLEVVYRLLDIDNRIFLFVNSTNMGCGYTKKRCVELAKGDFCAFIDPDDAIMPNAISKIINPFLQNHDISIVTSKYYLTDLELNIISKGMAGCSIPEGYSYLTFGRGALTHFAAFRKQSYNLTEGISPLYKRAVDQDLYLKLEEKGSHFFVDEFLYLYRITEKSISCNRNEYKAQYWNYVVSKDAYYRRLSSSESINFTRPQFKKMEYDYYISRIYFELKRKMILKSTYFFMLHLSKRPFNDICMKIKILFNILQIILLKVKKKLGSALIV